MHAPTLSRCVGRAFPFFYSSVGRSLAHSGVSRKRDDCPIYGRAVSPSVSRAHHRHTMRLSRRHTPDHPSGAFRRGKKQKPRQFEAINGIRSHHAAQTRGHPAGRLATVPRETRGRLSSYLSKRRGAGHLIVQPTDPTIADCRRHHTAGLATFTQLGPIPLPTQVPLAQPMGGLDQRRPQ